MTIWWFYYEYVAQTEESYLVVNPIPNKLPEHGVSLTADVSGCTCQVISDCLKVMLLPLDVMEAPTPLSATLSLLTL